MWRRRCSIGRALLLIPDFIMLISFLHYRNWKHNDASLAKAVSDLLVNLSAGWFGSIVVTPHLMHWKGIGGIIALLGNAVTGIVAFVFAVRIRPMWNFLPFNVQVMISFSLLIVVVILMHIAFRDMPSGKNGQCHCKH